MRRRRCVLGAAVAMVLALALGGNGCRRAPAPPVTHAAAGAESTAVEGEGAIYSAAKLPIPELGYNAREGQALYRHYCLNCHGEQGRGDGFNAYNLDPRPGRWPTRCFRRATPMPICWP